MSDESAPPLAAADLTAAGVTLDTYVAVQAAVAEGYALDVVLAHNGLDEAGWEAAEAAWAERMMESAEGDLALVDAHDRLLVRAQDAFRRRVSPLDEDLGAWTRFQRRLLDEPDALARLKEMGLGSTDLFRLQRAWASRLSEEEALRSDLLRHLQEPPGPFPKLDVEPRRPLPPITVPHRPPPPAPPAPEPEAAPDLPPLLADLPGERPPPAVRFEPTGAPEEAAAAPKPRELPSFLRAAAEAAQLAAETSAAAGPMPAAPPLAAPRVVPQTLNPSLMTTMPPTFPDPPSGDVTAEPQKSPLRAVLPFVKPAAAPAPPPAAPRPPAAAPAPPPAAAPAATPAAAPSAPTRELTVEQYASLCAELAVFSGEAERIFAKHGLATRMQRLTADLAWQDRLRTDAAAKAQWDRYYLTYHAYFTRLLQQRTAR